MQVQYRFSDSEISKLLKENFMVLYDTREQKNQHILDFLDKKKIQYKKKKINEGDYTAIITAREDMGISRNLYFNIAVERKNSVDELASIEVNYLKGIRFVDKKDAGRTILKLLYYSVMEALKERTEDIKAEQVT